MTVIQYQCPATIYKRNVAEWLLCTPEADIVHPTVELRIDLSLAIANESNIWLLSNHIRAQHLVVVQSHTM